jgi:ribonuclease J
MGAIPDIILEVPSIKVYGTKFTLEILRRELESENIKTDNLVEIEPHKKIDFKDNSVFSVRMTHSIPDAVGYVLNTKDGAIFYTGDFVFDPTMMGTYKTDIGKLGYIGKQGVLCLLAESTYASKEGHTSPHHRIKPLLVETFTRYEGRRIIFTVFSAHIHRIQELFDQIMVTNRKVVIMGKTLQYMISKAMELNYITFDKSKIGDLSNVNDKDSVILISNEREKPYAHLEKIVNGYDKYISIKPDDLVVIAQTAEEGNEKAEAEIMDAVAKIGADVVSLSKKKNLLYHASREDLMLMLNLLSPKYYFPVKGEYRRQYDNASCAENVGMKKENILLKQNGDVIEFVDGNLVETFEHVEVNDILIDGKNTGDIGELVLKDREMLSKDGIMTISATIEKKTKEILAGPEILTRGFIYVKDNSELIKEAEKISLEVIKENTSNSYIDYNKVKNGIRDRLGKYLYKETGCNPMIITVIGEV